MSGLCLQLASILPAPSSYTPLPSSPLRLCPPPHRSLLLSPSKRSTSPTAQQPPDRVDVVVIGSGLGGLSSAALLAKHGYSVVVCERHTIPGGCAHSFEREGYTFDSGPSLWSGCAAPSANPLRQVLDAVGESPEWAQYDGWRMYTQAGDFYAKAGDESAFRANLARLGGEGAVADWKRLRQFIQPLGKAVLALPPIALRKDPGVLSLALPWLPKLADPRIGLRAYLLSGPWSEVLKASGCNNLFLKQWFDFLAFAFSGLPSEGTVAAAMVYMLTDLYTDGAKMDYPIGGSGAVVDALVRGLEKYGGELLLRTPVKNIEVEDGAASGVTLANGKRITSRYVVSNAPVWATAALLPDEIRSKAAGKGDALDEETPPTPSFVHLHLGVRAEGLTKEALSSIHHIVIPSWDALMEPQSTVFVSIPSLLDPNLAPPGRHVIHAYLPATEPYELWASFKRGSPEYMAFKRERSECLYRAIEKFIPDIRERVELEMIGSPLTHERFLNRFKGTYGPELAAGVTDFPGAQTAVTRLLCCGDSTWPGIGVPAVAGSGMAAAHAIASAEQQKALLEDMRRREVLFPIP